MSTLTSSYRIGSEPLILSSGERKYFLTIHDLPDDERPRERLTANGPSALSTPELIAILFSSGTRKEGVLEMATRITKEYGEKNIMQEKNPARLAREVGLPVVKAMQIVAAAELGRRFFAKNEIASPVIRTAKDVSIT